MLLTLNYIFKYQNIRYKYTVKFLLTLFRRFKIKNSWNIRKYIYIFAEDERKMNSEKSFFLDSITQKNMSYESK